MTAWGADGSATWAAVDRYIAANPAAALPELLARAGRALVALQTPAPTPAPEPDRLLSVKEAAHRLGKSVDHLYRHASRYPFTVRDGRAVRFSQRGIEAYIARQQRRPETV